MSKREQAQPCFYCNALVSTGGVGDHFPVPKCCGGTETVPCCLSCHDMKDRFNLADWPAEWIAAINADFPRMSRETRIFLAKTMRVAQEAMQRKAKA